MNAEQIAANVPASWTKIPAAQQRALFGAVPFGRIAVRRNASGRGVDVKVSAGFGGDYNIQTVAYSEVSAAIADSRIVRFCR